MTSKTEAQIYVTTKTGRKIHTARPGSSVTSCGHWLKFEASNYKVSEKMVESYVADGKKVVCEKCSASHDRREVRESALEVAKRQMAEAKARRGF